MATIGIEIIVGTYEEFLLGYKVVLKEEKYELQQSFADHSHKASIRCLSSCVQLMASGSADETIYLYDTITRKEIGVLMQHSGTVRSLAFSSDGSHLFSGSEDGSIAVFRTGSWQLEKIWHKAHKGEAVTCISIHPSGKLALSLGNDGTLRTWNLIKGRQAYATNLGKQRTLGGKALGAVLWSPNGNTYAVAVGLDVDVYDTASAGVVYTIKLDKKVTSMYFLQGNLKNKVYETNYHTLRELKENIRTEINAISETELMCMSANFRRSCCRCIDADAYTCAKETEIVVGDESGRISWYSTDQKKLLQQVQAHENRVKCINSMKNTQKFAFVSASSIGEIKLWQQKNDSFEAVCKVNCGCRITCMVIATKNETWHAEQQKSRKHKINEEVAAKSVKGVKPEVYRSTQICRNIRKCNKKQRTESSVICTSGQNWLVESVEQKL